MHRESGSTARLQGVILDVHDCISGHVCSIEAEKARSTTSVTAEEPGLDDVQEVLRGSGNDGEKDDWDRCNLQSRSDSPDPEPSD